MKKRLSILIPVYNDVMFIKQILEGKEFQIDDQLK